MKVLPYGTTGICAIPAQLQNAVYNRVRHEDGRCGSPQVGFDLTAEG